MIAENNNNDNDNDNNNFDDDDNDSEIVIEEEDDDDDDVATTATTTSFPIFELSLDASSDIHGLTIAIQQLSNAVKEVRVDIYNSFTSRWDEEDIEDLFTALGDIPCLEKIEFYGLRIFPYTMPITMAERTLKRATVLKEFCIVGINLAAESPLDFHNFSETLQTHPTLKAFGLDNCRLKHEAMGPTLDDAIVNSLIQIPTLEKVVIRAIEPSLWGTLSCRSVGLLCSCCTLKSLELFVFSNCQKSFMVEMANALIKTKDTSQLEDISISGFLGGIEGSKTISEMVMTNNILKSLQLHLRTRTEEDEPGIIELSKALLKNKTLTNFQLHGPTDQFGSLDTKQAFLNMLQSNYTLTETVLVFHPGFLRPHSEFYLKLNQVGRGELLGNSNYGKKKWVDTLIDCGNDIDCIYYFLITNPSLCSTSVPITVDDDTNSTLAIDRLTNNTTHTGTSIVESVEQRKRKRSSCETTITPQRSVVLLPAIS